MSYNSTRFLVLDQPLPGQETRLTEPRAPKRIYRAQKAPDWVVEEQEPPDEETFVDQLHDGRQEGATDYEMRVRRRNIAEPEIVYDPTEAQVESQKISKEAEPQMGPNGVVTAEEAKQGEESEGTPEPIVHEEFDLSKLENLDVPEPEVPLEPESDAEDAQNIRDRLKERARLKQQMQAESAKGPKIEGGPSVSESEDESDSSEYSDDINVPARPRRMKPMFLTKKARKKLQTRSRPEEIKNKLEKYEKQCKKDQKEEARKNLYAIVRVEDQKNKKAGESDEDIPDTDDDADEEEQFEAWKLRELKRIKREKDALDLIEEEKLVLERRRNMTDKEIQIDNEEHGVRKNKSQRKMKFMQKYYHKGAFFQDDNLVDQKIMERNYLAPTREDKFIDFETVPDIMRVKNFGMMSQTKWTHLVNEDTTNLDNQDDDVMRNILDSRNPRKPGFLRGRWNKNQSLSRPSKSKYGGYTGRSRRRDSGRERSPEPGASKRYRRDDDYHHQHQQTHVPPTNQYASYPPSTPTQQPQPPPPPIPS